MKIALVDDDTQARSMLARAVRNAGYQISLEAGDGHEALNSLPRCDADLIITDCQMPRMDGISLVRNLRQRGDQRPILMLSGQSDPLVVKLALSAGVTRYLTKPLNPKELLNAIHPYVPAAA